LMIVGLLLAASSSATPARALQAEDVQQVGGIVAARLQTALAAEKRTPSNRYTSKANRRPATECQKRSPEPWPAETPDVQLSSHETCKDFPSPDELLTMVRNGGQLKWSGRTIDPEQMANFSRAWTEDFHPSKALQAAEGANLLVFIASPRSGHTLIGALLDAHPNVVLAEELGMVSRYRWLPVKEDHPSDKDTAKPLKTRKDMLSKIVEQSTACGFLGRYQTGYSYSVRGAYNGQWSCRIDAFGDKSGGQTTKFLLGFEESRSTQEPVRAIHQALKTFGTMVDQMSVPAVKVIAVHTNDNKSDDSDKMHLRSHLGEFCNGVVNCTDPGRVSAARDLLLHGMSWPRHVSHGGETHETTLDVLDIDDFACDPERWLRKLCRFVGLDEDEDYIKKAVAMVDAKYCHATGQRSSSERRHKADHEQHEADWLEYWWLENTATD